LAAPRNFREETLGCQLMLCVWNGRFVNCEWPLVTSKKAARFILPLKSRDFEWNGQPTDDVRAIAHRGRIGL